MLALGFLPCGDESECNDNAEQQTLVPYQQEQEADDCSPFCACACCAASAYHQNFPSAKAFTFFSKASIFFYKFELNSYDYHSVWQPPKLS